MARRRAFTLVEVVLAALVLALAVGSLMVLSHQENRGVAISRERYFASQELAELSACFGTKSRAWFEASAIPPTRAAWDARVGIYESLLAEHPAFLAAGHPERAPVAGAELLAQRSRLELGPALLYQPFTAADGRRGGVVTLSVRFRDAGAVVRELVAHRVVY